MNPVKYRLVVDTYNSKSIARKSVRVQIPPSAPIKTRISILL